MQHTRPGWETLSLGLPLSVQAGLSLGLILLMGLIAWRAPRARGWVFLLCLASTLRHLCWRGLETLSPQADPFANTLHWLVYGAELLAFGATLLWFLQVCRAPATPAPPATPSDPPAHWPAIDVLIYSHGEPVGVVYRTLVCCRDLDYPRKTVYLYDAVHRPVMQQLADKLGLIYLSATNPPKTRAHGLNQALDSLRSDYLALFDADQIPANSFLRETIGFFLQDPTIRLQRRPVPAKPGDPPSPERRTGPARNTHPAGQRCLGRRHAGYRRLFAAALGPGRCQRLFDPDRRPGLPNQPATTPQGLALALSRAPPCSDTPPRAIRRLRPDLPPANPGSRPGFRPRNTPACLGVEPAPTLGL